ncbi:MAG: shikimate kinase AroK [Gammaproteobacteria bacterium]|nr:shikimate kinase AroK [Gammaproteobacteria bacterium]
MVKKQNIFLIGPMGAGKTTIGRQLATRRGLEFVDSDHELQKRTGVDIPTIFEFEGEDGFRLRERDMVDELSQREGVVLATGGGVVLIPDNRRNLSGRGTVIYLYCPPEQQFERTRHDKNRPLLQTPDPLARLRALFEVRDPLYRELADIIIITDRRSASTVIKEILQRLPEPD